MALDIDPRHVFRDFKQTGNPGSGLHNPVKAEIRALLYDWWRTLMGLAADAGDIDLPNLMIHFTVTGGTANAITATPDLPLPGPGTALMSILTTVPNTGSVTINGKQLLTSGGNQIAPGGLTPGTWLFMDDGSNYRLVSDQASASIVAAAEAAALAAISAAGANISMVDSRQAALGIDFPPIITYVRTAGYALAGDGGGALYKKSASEPTHGGKFQSADGAWWEIDEVVPNVRMFGAKGDATADDQAAVSAAVAFAYSKGLDVYWPSGQYLTTASITNLHNVRHRGPGAIKRGSELFFVEPWEGNSNIIYVATTGNANNDGLSASQPINTLQGGLDAMENYGPVLNGSWTLQVAAGTYAEAVTTGLRSANAVTIKGPDVSGGVPTVVLDGGSGTRNFGIYAGPYINFNVYDIKAQNYSAYGFVAHNASMMNLYNCHGSGSTEAQANAEDRSRLYILGGVYNGGKYGVRVYSQSTGSIRKETRYNTAAQFNNATASGIYVRENSNARADDFTSDGCNIAANAANSRLHVVNATITNASVGCQADRGGEVYDDNVTYGAGVTVRRRRLSGGRFLAQSSAVSENTVINTTPIVHTGSTSVTTLWQGPSIEAFELNNSGKAIEVEIRGKWGSGATATTLYVALDGSVGNLSQVNSPTNSPNVFLVRAVILPRGVNSQLVHTELITHAATSVTATTAARTADVSTDRAIQVRALLGNSADSLTIDYIKVTRLG